MEGRNYNLAKAGNLEMILPSRKSEDSQRVIRACSFNQGKMIFNRAAYSFLYKTHKCRKETGKVTFNDVNDWMKQFSKYSNLSLGRIDGAVYGATIDIPQRTIYLEGLEDESALISLAKNYSEKMGFEIRDRKSKVF